MLVLKTMIPHSLHFYLHFGCLSFHYPNHHPLQVSLNDGSKVFPSESRSLKDNYLTCWIFLWNFVYQVFWLSIMIFDNQICLRHLAKNYNAHYLAPLCFAIHYRNFFWSSSLISHTSFNILLNHVQVRSLFFPFLNLKKVLQAIFDTWISLWLLHKLRGPS